ncbi:MAG TPA: thioesterase family protein [Planctomycetota bacterium]|jgi:4-hydroxybenzoyl-CoA thioesterase|nr:thioesterase family protein [Planctomycetota bacterium]
MAFRTTVKVRFGDVDRAGIAYYPRIFDFFHVAFEEFWDRYIGISYAKVVTEEHLGFPLIDAHAEFRAPLRYGDELTVSVFLKRVGGTSATWGYRIDSPRGERCCDAELTTVCVDMRTWAKRPVPDAYRKKFEACRAE